MSLIRSICARSAIAGFTLLIGAGPVAAHHSFAAEFDANKPMTIRGTVTKMDWMNPHSWIYLDVKGEDGNVTNWRFELGSPSSMFRQGWKKDSVPLGIEVEILLYRARSGSNVGNCRSVKLPDGRELFSGGSAPDLSSYKPKP